MNETTINNMQPTRNQTESCNPGRCPVQNCFITKILEMKP